MPQILLIEDDPTFAVVINGFLSKNGYSVNTTYRGKEGIDIFENNHFDLVIMDYRLPDLNGLELLSQLKVRKHEVPIIVMTAFSDIKTAVNVMKKGALDYITKPINPDELKLLISQALDKTNAEKSKSKSKSTTKGPAYVEGKSHISEMMHSHVNLVAPTDMSVIIEGESGTGKEYVANAIHRKSSRSNSKFLAVDCGALSKELAASELFGHVKGAFTGATNDKEGKFVAADGGTLFLDEVGNLSYEVQVKLLRALQERTIQPVGSNKQISVDVRVITATNEDLVENVKTGSFREDLYHRLNEFKIKVPALRNRGEDLAEFAEFFRKEANIQLDKNVPGFTDEAMEIIEMYDWPGNLRELKNTVKRAVLLSDNSAISPHSLPPEMAAVTQTITPKSKYDLKAIQGEKERELILKTLEETRFNKSKTARLLNIDRKTLYLKLNKYNIKG